MAVYTHITNDQLKAFLGKYALGTLCSYEEIAQGVSNSNYHLFTDQGRYILTLFEEWRTDIESLPFYFAFSLHLGGKGIPCPQPVADKNGALYGDLAGKKAAILSFLPGRVVEAGDITPDLCGQLGAFVAKMHEGAKDFSQVKENGMGWAAWKILSDKAAPKADRVEEGLYSLLTQELDYLKENWPDDLPKAAVHTDIFPDNVFIKDGNIDGVIDFYFSCTESFVYDLAIVINAWCFDKECHFVPERYRALMQGYEGVRVLNEAEKKAMSFMGRAGAMRFLSTRLHDWVFHDPKSVATPHDPRDYIKRLRFFQNDPL